AAAVVALARVALGVLVGEHRADGLHHLSRDEVLGGDELEPVALTSELAVDELEELPVAWCGAGRGGRVAEGSRRGRVFPRVVAGYFVHAAEYTAGPSDRDFRRKTAHGSSCHGGLVAR